MDTIDTRGATGALIPSLTTPSLGYRNISRTARNVARSMPLLHAGFRWLYLEPILSGDDGELGLKFRKVNQGFRQVARAVEADSRLSTLVQSARLRPMLDSISEQLHVCQAALNQYIDDKRSIFPRFYFLSDDDLLELLGQARAGAEGRAVVIQTHLRKLFPGITGVKLGPGDLSITALCSHHEEIFYLDRPVDIDCPVEVWLKNVENEMYASLKNLLLNYIMNTSPKNNDVFSLPVQILCLAQNIRFTEQAERAITAKELHKLNVNLEKERNYYAEVETDDDNERLKRQALILQCTYYLNVIQLLIDNNVASTSQWLWQKQLRFYLLNTKEVVAKMGLAEFSYSYEYLGMNTGQFARTELSDQCFLVLTQAFHLGLVGNPFGPAGTGKTESVKALGGLVGRLVLVFNCDEAMDSVCMGRLLSGLARCGAWGCFDELNRLTAPTLAALSQHLYELLSALTDHSASAQRTVTINGNQIAVSERCAVAATMNPAGRGYGGRRALPAALQRVLRPVAMCQPRGDILARHLLAARAILNSQRLADDLHQVFYMASELLSIQRHYDWGLRALKATVCSCGEALAAASPARQRAVLRAALRHSNMSKLTKDDAQRFQSILSVVFADVSEEELLQTSLTEALKDTVKTLGLLCSNKQIQKCVQLHEQLQQRMGVVLVGPPGSGKTTIRQILKMTLMKQGTNIVEYVICPKAMSRTCLLGQIDVDTRQWTDGVISSTALEISNQSDDVWSWVVCDGDVEPEWVEALNSVLDDNRLLTLPSGWRIQFGPNVNFIFETHTLEHASPATVSRMGVILLSEENNCAQEVLDVWLSKNDFENESSKMAVEVLQRTIKKIISWFPMHRSDFEVNIHLTSLINQILIQFEYVAQNSNATAGTTPEDIVYFSIQRSVMTCLKHVSIHDFHEMISEILGVAPITSPLVGEWRGDSVYMSPRLARAEPALKAALTSSHLLVIGPPACSKNTLTEYVLKDSGSSMIINIDCTPILEPSDIVEELKRRNIVRAGGRGSARGEDSGAVLFVRSLHRAHIDTWGSSPVQAFLLQMIQHGGFWEQISNGDGGRSVQWCGVRRLRVVVTADVETVRLCPRLSNALCIVNLAECDDEETLELTKNCLIKNIDYKVVTESYIGNLATNILSIYKEAKVTFRNKTHYKWNVCDINKWCDSIKWYDSKELQESLVPIIETEANSIFKDRLVTEQEKTMFSNILRKHLKITNSSGIYFAAKQHDTGVYMKPTDYRNWYQTTQKVINQCINEHEYSVFGDTGAEACGEMSVLCPAMARATNGSITVCVGSAGMGRRAAAQVVASALPAALYTVNFPSEFSIQMRNGLLAAGGEGNRTLILVCEPAVCESALGSIEALLNARSPYALPREMLQVLSHNHQPMQFLQNIKNNLGIIILLEKEQNNLSKLMDKFPFLYKLSHLVWLDGWSNETLRQMPQLIIQRSIKGDVSENDPEVHESIPVDCFIGIYNSLEVERLKTPCRYVNFVKTYYNIVRRKKKTLTERQKMLSAGVEALRHARSEVAILEVEASQQEAALSDKRASATHALEQIGATVRTATGSKDEMHALKRNIEIENEKLQIRKKEIEAELAAVEPVIAAARAAVGDIKPEALSEVRSLRAPPDVVRDILEGVLRLMGIADTSWHSMKNFLSKRGVKEDIRCLDASQISPESAQSVRRLLERRGTSFDERVAKRASAACAPLAAWVRANLAHAEVLERVQPLQMQQRELHKNLQAAEAELLALSSGLEDIEERVSSLQEQLGQHTRDAVALELKLTNATGMLNTARELLQQLAAEYDVWEADLGHIQKEIQELSLRSILVAAYIVYLPECSDAETRNYVKKWIHIIGLDDPDFSVVNFLCTTEKQLKWDADGLPPDMISMKNAVLIDQFLESKKCGLTPLIIDPDGDAIDWLKNSLSGSSCDFLSQHSEKLHTAVQQSMRFGRVLVVTEVDKVHPSWAPLLLGLPASGGVGTVHSNFRLLLYARDPSLPMNLEPAHHATLAVLDFTARVDGLTDQLIYFALQHENPEVRERSREIKIKKATLQKQQYELQENLLKDLSRNTDILHDATLLESLNKTRETSTTIAEALEAARTMENHTMAARIAYEPGARCAAQLGLSVRHLSQHWQLINLPIDVLLQLFVDALSNGGRNVEDNQSLNNDEIIKFLLKRITERVLLALHKKDKYVVVLHLLKEVYSSLIPENLWQLFIQNAKQLVEDHDVNVINQKYSWIPKDFLRNVAAVQSSNPELFNKLELDNSQLWKEFQKTEDLNLLSKLKLNSFEQLIAVATFRPESLYRAINAFVDQVLGSGIMSAGEEVARSARWGACAGGRRAPRPLVVLGTHAADQVAAYAAAHARPLYQTWVGEGLSSWQASVERARNGGWLVLSLGASPFTPELSAFLAGFSQEQELDFDPEFRLWVVCEDRNIPPLVANACVNVILEAPEGVKNNVLNTLSAWSTFESSELQLVRTLACLALLHALIQERRAYIPEGWSQWYDFEWGDVNACQRAVTKCGVGARSCAAGLCEALYAGRVSSPPDSALLAVLVQDTLGEHTLSPSWKPKGLTAPLPFDKRLKTYASALSALPSLDSADLLGLPANCRVAWETKAAQNIISGLKELYTTVDVKLKKDEDTPLKFLLTSWKKLMSGSPFIKGYINYETKVSWWGCVCAGEAQEAARAVRAVHATLSAARDRTDTALLNNVPEEWLMQWWGPASPQRYVRELAQRARHAAARLQPPVETPQDYFPKEIDLRTFLNPRRVLAAFRARTAARLHCAPDTLDLYVKWDCATTEGDDDNVVIQGLRLSGAVWGRGLEPAPVHAPPHSPAPPLMLRYTQRDNKAMVRYRRVVPVYSSEARDMLLCEVHAPPAPALSPRTIILNAVALFVAESII